MAARSREEIRIGRKLTVLLSLVAMLAAGCSTDPADPQEELAASVDATFADSFAFAFAVDADAGALSSLGEGAAQAGLFLAGFGVDGRRDADHLVLRIRVIGIDALELRSLGGEATYLRLGIRELAAIAGGALDFSEVLPALAQLGLPAEVEAAVAAALDGHWVGIEGSIDTERIRALLGEDRPGLGDAEASLRAALGDDPRAFVERFVVVTADTERDGERTYRVQLRLRDLLAAVPEVDAPLDGRAPDLEDAPETVPGTVVVRDGRVAEIRFDLAEIAREAGQDVAGNIDLRLRLTDHGRVDTIDPPEGATTVPADVLLDALERLLAFAVG